MVWRCLVCAVASFVKAGVKIGGWISLLSVDLAVPQQLHWSGTDTTETPVSRLSCTTAVTLVRYGHNRDACQST